jgi:putative addiction module killer protein
LLFLYLHAPSSLAIAYSLGLDCGSVCVTINTVELREYLDRGGRSPFATWSDRLNREAAAKVAAALARIQLGNFSNVKGVHGGVFECRINFGPGYRITSAKMATSL